MFGVQILPYYLLTRNLVKINISNNKHQVEIKTYHSQFLSKMILQN